jgi:hypothetical protein
MGEIGEKFMPNDRISAIRETNATCHSIGASNLTTTAISVLLDNCDFLLTEIDRLTEAQRWIPITERKPTKDDALESMDDVVWLFPDRPLNMGRVIALPWWDGKNATHWQPLPAAIEKRTENHDTLPCGIEDEGDCADCGYACKQNAAPKGE